MSLTSAEIGAVVTELQGVLPGQILSKINSPIDKSIQFVFRRNVLWIQWHAGMTRLNLVDKKIPSHKTPEPWVMKARAELRGRILQSIEQLGDDRIVELKFSGSPSRSLLVELFGKSKVLILGAKREIIVPLVGNTASGFYRLPPDDRLSVHNDNRFGKADCKTLSVNRAVEEFYSSRAAEHRLSAAKAKLRKELRAKEKKLLRKISAMEKDLKRTEKTEELSRQAQAIKYQLSTLRKGQNRALLPDPFDPSAQMIEVELDPALDPLQNMQKKFSKAKRLNGAKGKIGPRLTHARAELENLRELYLRVAMADSEQALSELRPQTDSLKATAFSSSTTRNKSKRRQPYRIYTSAKGLTIMVGKSGKDNHQLTFHVAKGHDMWFHATGAAGAHVVVRLERGKDLDEQSLLDAATLAATNSPSANDSKVEVTYTKVKNVHPIKNAPPGKVSVSNVRTILVRMEPERIRRLKESLLVV